MTSLVEQLTADALNRTVPITDLLRKAKTAAVKLERPDLEDWIEHELSGYPSETAVPPYRRLYAEYKYHNPPHGWFPILGKQKQWNCGQPISEISSLLESKGAALLVSVPSAIEKEISKKLGLVVEVKRHVSRSALARIPEAVRDAVLDWSLKLEKAGIQGEGLTFSLGETQKAQSVVINIGNIGNAIGLGAFGDNVAITGTQKFIESAESAAVVDRLLKEFERLLPISGLPSEVQAATAPALAELRNATE